MQRLQFPLEDPLTVYDAILGVKTEPRRTHLQVSRQAVERRYGVYWRLAQSLGLETITGSAFVDPYAEALLHAYSGETAPLSAMKVRVREAQAVQWQDACPYCGINSPDEFDHYLGKERFPEFATLLWNLVPCCGQCNGLKGATWLDAGVRQFVHAYFDVIPELERWLYCDLVVSGQDVVATFSLEWPRSLPRALQRILERHYAKLDLCARYRRRSSRPIAENLAEGRRFTEDEYAAEYALSAARLGTLYGVNYWESCLMEAMAKSEPFLALVAV